MEPGGHARVSAPTFIIQVRPVPTPGTGHYHMPMPMSTPWFWTAASSHVVVDIVGAKGPSNRLENLLLHSKTFLEDKVGLGHCHRRGGRGRGCGGRGRDRLVVLDLGLGLGRFLIRRRRRCGDCTRRQRRSLTVEILQLLVSELPSERGCSR